MFMTILLQIKSNIHELEAVVLVGLFGTYVDTNTVIIFMAVATKVGFLSHRNNFYNLKIFVHT